MLIANKFFECFIKIMGYLLHYVVTCLCACNIISIILTIANVKRINMIFIFNLKINVLIFSKKIK